MTKKIVVCIVLIILGLNFFSSQSLALTVSPAKFEFSADPGDTIQSQIILINEQKIPLVFQVSFERMTVRGEYGEPVFTGEKIDLATWIKVTPSKVTLGPGEEKKIPLIIDVPKNADPGGHYAAIFWRTVSPEGGGSGMGITMRVAALVLLSVSGEVIELGEILNFRADKELVNSLPINFDFGFKNTGTVHLKPEGEIVIKNIFGKRVEILEANSEGYNVLPQSERIFSTSWGSKSEIKGEGFLAELKREKTDFALGYYRAILNLEFGEKKETAQTGFGFWVIPWRILLLSFLIFGGISLGITQGVKQYNNWIVAKAIKQIDAKKVPKRVVVKRKKIKKRRTRKKKKIEIE